MYPKIFIGPMSKNVVDAILELSIEEGTPIGLIPSRRQVEWDGGYVNNWTTKSFSKYASRLPLKRDHAGPMQGYLDDDGYESLKHDCKYLDYIHVDPWKEYPEYKDGLRWTIDIINFCHKENPHMKFEVGTEEAIRRFSHEELDALVLNLWESLTPEAFCHIEYLVVQSGTSLRGNENTGSYDKGRLGNMVNVCKKYNLLSKEHNGDYLPTKLVREKFDAGLDSINIAPEFGQIETKAYLDMIKKKKPHLLDVFYRICFESRRWEKWVDESFDPLTQKEDLINICGHYVLSNPDFIKGIELKFDNISHIIKSNVKKKIKTLL